MTYESKSKKLLEKQGYIVDVAEHKGTRFYKNKKDTFGFIDLLAIRGDEPGVLGVQVTSYSNTSHRIKKIIEECEVQCRTWLEAGNRIEVHGWWEDGSEQMRKVYVYLVGNEIKYDGNPAK